MEEEQTESSALRMGLAQYFVLTFFPPTTNNAQLQEAIDQIPTSATGARHSQH
jgi:hypothetical protein